MRDERTATEQPTAAGDVAEQPRPFAEQASSQQDTWLEEDSEELPPRPRRHVLRPLPLALLAALAIACGFIAGVLVEKGQTGSGTGAGAGATGAFASRLAALRGEASTGGTGRRAGSSSGSSTGSGSLGAGATSGAGSAGLTGAGGAGSATVGQVAYAANGTLYVTTSEGNTVKVTAAAGASVTKTVKASVKSIHPGETVVVAGAAGTNGAIAASSIRIGGLASALGGSAGALLGGATGGSAGATAGGTTGGSGEAQLFGKG